MKLNPQLPFDGECEAALKFYADVLGAKTEFKMTWGDSPMGKQMPPAWGKKIVHATFTVADQVLGAADAPPDRYEKPQGVAIALNIDAPEEADRVFKALSKGGAVSMPIQETFWALRFAMFTDKFGIPWMINCGKPIAK